MRAKERRDTQDAALRARQVLAAGGPRLILGLPAAALRPELEPAVSAIFRHLLEDPATLQAAMEAEIRSALAGWAGNARGGAGAGAYDGAPPAALRGLLVCELLLGEREGRVVDSGGGAAGCAALRYMRLLCL